ncbi:MAG: glycosyltransferase family 2 protein [Geobacteraceae bacterium]|nr:glycosyltransferase family 2 protein [Geobacteraceae bacterium]
MKLLFWLSLIFVLYTYAGYPLVLWMLSFFRNKRTLVSGQFPSVSVVIAALNEENNIGRRIENLLAQEYPSDKLEILVISDGSTDGTEEIARSFTNRGVTVYGLPDRNGKAMALNYGVSKAKGDIIVFTDARQTFEVGAIAHLTASFSDESVGCVSGELHFLNDVESGIQVEMGAYWRYEKWLRKNESATGSVVGATGAIYAIRRELYRPLPQGTLLDDVLTPMNIVMKGHRTVFNGAAVAYDIVSKDFGQEWKRKVRTLAGNWQLLTLSPALLLPWQNPYWWRFLAHKIFRLLVPFLLPVMVAFSAFSIGPLYSILTYLQLVLYGIAGIGMLAPSARKVRIVNLSCFFLVMNLAAIAGFWRWVTGGCRTAWQPAYADQGGKKL